MGGPRTGIKSACKGAAGAARWKVLDWSLGMTTKWEDPGQWRRILWQRQVKKIKLY